MEVIPIIAMETVQITVMEVTPTIIMETVLTTVTAVIIQVLLISMVQVMVPAWEEKVMEASSRHLMIMYLQDMNCRYMIQHNNIRIMAIIMDMVVNNKKYLVNMPDTFLGERCIWK